jgi:4-hydroxy-tetrahydrodipicolinate synthase
MGTPDGQRDAQRASADGAGRTALPGSPGWLPSGVLPALATPLGEDGELDHAGLGRLLDHILAHPVTGMAPVGTTGEGPLLSRRIRVAITSRVVERARDARPPIAVIPAAVATTPADVQADIESYAEAGAHAALVGTPFYYPMGAAAVARWFTDVAERSPLPVVLYHFPDMTKVRIPADVAGDLAAHPTVIGMKDSSRDFEYHQSVLAATEGLPFGLLTGADTLLLASGLLGGAGTIAASVNLVPGLVTSVWSALQSGDQERARSIQWQLQAVVQVCRRAGGPAGWKAALELAGICPARGASPNTGITAEARQRLRDDLDRLGVLAPVSS